MTEDEQYPTSLKLNKIELLFVLIIAGIYVYLRSSSESPIIVASIGFALALWLIIKPTEWAVEGLTLLSERVGIGRYAAGVLGSIMANLPELILATLLILRGQSNIGILTVLVVAGANTLLFGVIIIRGSVKKGGSIKVPVTTLRYESELMAFAFITSLFLFVFNFAEMLEGNLVETVVDGETVLQVKIPVFFSLGTVAIYIAYLVFIAKDKELNPVRTPEKKAKMLKEPGLQWGNIMKFLLVGVIGIILAGELLANGAELLIEEAETSGLKLGEAHIALIVGGLGSLPEWAIAFKADEDMELVFGSVLSSISATLLFMIGLVSIFLFTLQTNFQLDAFAIVQYVLSGAILIFVYMLMKDDEELDAFEGIAIVILQLISFSVLLSV